MSRTVMDRQRAQRYFQRMGITSGIVAFEAMQSLEKSLHSLLLNMSHFDSTSTDAKQTVANEMRKLARMLELVDIAF